MSKIPYVVVKAAEMHLNHFLIISAIAHTFTHLSIGEFKRSN